MVEVTQTLMVVMREAWRALAGALAAFVFLAMLAQTLRVTGSTLLGARYWAAQAVAGIVGVMVLALFGFVGVPVIVKATLTNIPSRAGCGPIVELAALSAGLIGALAALRMLKAVFTTVVVGAAGGAVSMADTLIESAEAVLGMAIAAAAIPIAVRFLGGC